MDLTHNLSPSDGQAKAGSSPALGLSAEQVGKACGIAPPPIWPLVVDGLKEFGIDSLNVEIAAAATCAVECNFKPICERLADPKRQPDLFRLQSRYWPWCGRGLIQLSWESNYRKAGAALHIDLIAHPELALVPRHAARILAWFFYENGVDKAANAQDWRKVRRLVNGGLNGWERFHDVVLRLLEVEK